MSAGKLSTKLTQASLWSLSGKIGAKLLDLPALIVLAQLLSQEDFGLVAKAMSVIVVLEAVTNLPIVLPILKITNPSREVYNTAFTLSVLRGVFIFLLVAAAAWPISIYFKEPRLPSLLLALSFAPIFRGISSPMMANFLRIYNLRPDALADIISKITSFFVVILVAYFTRSYWSLVAGTVVTTFVRFSYTYIVAPYRPAFSLDYWSSFWDILGWNTVVQITQALSWQMDAFLLGRALVPSIFGQYSVSSNLNSLPHQAVLLPIIRPMSIGFLNSDNESRRDVLWLKFSNTTLYIVGPILISMAVLSDVAVKVLLGPQWQDAGVFLFGLSLASVVALPGMPMNALAISLHRSRMMASRTFIQLVIMFPLMLVGLHFGGAIGVLVAKGVTEIIMMIVTMFFVRRLTGLPLSSQFGALTRSIVGLVVLAATLYLLQFWMIGSRDSTSRLVLAAEALLTFGVALFVYLATTCALWWAQGRPNSIETIIVSRVRQVFARVLQPRGR